MQPASFHCSTPGSQPHLEHTDTQGKGLQLDRGLRMVGCRDEASVRTVAGQQLLPRPRYDVLGLGRVLRCAAEVRQMDGAIRPRRPQASSRRDVVHVREAQRDGDRIRIAALPL